MITNIYNNKTFIIIALLIMIFFGTRISAIKRQIPPCIRKIPEFNMISHSGEIITSNNFNSKFTIIDFMYTECTEICPKMNSHTKLLYDKYESFQNVQFFSISVDPQNDTPDVLNEYANLNQVNDGRWKFIYGNIKDVETFARRAFSILSDDFPASHSRRMFLVDKNGFYRQSYNGTTKKDIGLLNSHLKQLLNNNS